MKPVILDEVGRRGQSFSAEAKRKAKGSQYKSSVPSIIVWNVKFLDNKTSEPGVLIMTQREYCELCWMCFFETLPLPTRKHGDCTGLFGQMAINLSNK